MTALCNLCCNVQLSPLGNSLSSNGNWKFTSEAKWCNACTCDWKCVFVWVRERHITSSIFWFHFTCLSYNLDGVNLSAPATQFLWHQGPEGFSCCVTANSKYLSTNKCTHRTYSAMGTMKMTTKSLLKYIKNTKLKVLYSSFKLSKDNKVLSDDYSTAHLPNVWCTSVWK